MICSAVGTFGATETGDCLLSTQKTTPSSVVELKGSHPSIKSLLIRADPIDAHLTSHIPHLHLF
jgi:hypothetical protein